MTALINNLHHEGAREVCRAHNDRPDALLEILHETQKADGHLSDEALVTIADALNISRADIHGVVSFYHDYRREEPAQHQIQLCRAEACQAVGSEALAAHAEKKLDVATGEKTADNKIGLSAVYCLGNCALGPAAMIDGKLIGRMTPERLDVLIAKLMGAPS
ncbi:MAG: NADH-quinone oxidoreductase subunit E [Hyphococcus sp.]|nr:MAG: NADH-quinone oxidoreductase subunit E [Marinicaulis sp.]